VRHKENIASVSNVLFIVYKAQILLAMQYQTSAKLAIQFEFKLHNLT